MENISPSIPKRRSFTSYSNAFTAPHHSVYEDVFGGPPKVGIPTLAPRFEDYAEIFGGFHAYRSSSIPILHLPSVTDDSELHFEVRGTDFDYAEVFGGFRGFGSAASYKDLVGQSGGRYDSSDQPWSPAQSESLSDEVEPLAASDKSYTLPDGDVDQSLESIKQFNIFYNKYSKRTMETVLNSSRHVTNLGTTPAYTNPSNDRSVPPNDKDELCSMHVIDDISCSKDFSERVAEEKRHDKSLLTSSYSGFAMHGYDFNPSEKHGYSSSTLDKPFMTISDISLRTKPSQLPPPSRPPPALAAKNGECDRSNSIFGASKSYASERVLHGTSPYLFDVEVDVTSSAQGVENGNKSFRVKQRDTEKINEKNDIQAHSKLHLEALKMEEKTNKTFSLSRTLRGEKMQESHKIETIGSVPSIEESLRVRKSTEPISESQGGKYHNHFAKNSMGTVAWREAKEYFEVMERKKSKEAFEKVEGGDTLKQSTTLDAYKHQGTVESEEFHQKQDSMRIRAIKEDPMWDEDRNPLEMAAEDCDCGNEHGRIKANNRLSNKKEVQDKVILNKLTCVYNLNKMIPETFQQPCQKLRIDHGVIVEKHEEAICHELEAKSKLEAASEKMETERGFIYAHSRKEKNGNHKENIVTAEYQRRPEEAVERAETRERVKERIELEENDTQQKEGREKENVKKLNETHEHKENEMRVKQAVEHRDCGKELFTDVVHAKIMVNEQLHCKLEKDKEAGKQEATEMRFGNCPEHFRDDKKQKEFHDCEIMKDRGGDSLEREVNDVGILTAETEVGNKVDPFEREIELHLYGDASIQEELSGRFQSNGHLKEVNWDLESHVHIEGDRLRVFDEASKCDDENATEVAGKHNDPLKMEETQAILSVEGNGKLNDEPESRVHEPEARMDDPLFNEKINRFGKNKVELQDRNSHCVTNHTSDSPSLLEYMKYLNKGDHGNGNTCVMVDKIAPEIVFGHETETMKRISTEDERLGKAGAHFIKKEDFRDSLVFRESVESGNMMEGASPVVSEQNEDALSSSRNASIRKVEIKENNKNENLAPKDQQLRESLRNETVLENEHMRKIKEEREREREREREKDRMAVDKEALETHTKLYAEARERAAVGRTAEVRQRVMSEARERLELASNEARLRAERAAVERATAEARQRAIEKSIAEKSAFDTRERVEKPMSDRFSMSSRSADTRRSPLSTDLHHQSTGISNGLRNSYASAHFGAEGESPQRCKARLQRYQRTAERAANALAEKNMRDLLAQREREERNRVAETLDIEVRRWSSGKERNLRALLSTLQYILGPDSGWQPVPLTEVITSAAVKKAYRRATLCVHPDKLQQRGATIQQKYICDKVFDLLKEAWNKFNSEER